MSRSAHFAAPSPRRPYPPPQPPDAPPQKAGDARHTSPTNSAIDARLAAHAGRALLVANLRYWSSVAQLVSQQLGRWRGRAQEIGDPTLRRLASQKLAEEGFNAEVAAMLATLAPRAHRGDAVTAVVALEVLYDYLDGLTESPSHESPDDGYRLFAAFTDAVTPLLEPCGDYYRYHPHSDDGGYLDELVATVRTALAKLPSAQRFTDILQRSATRGAEAQLRIHAATLSGPGQLERWAKLNAAGTPLQWREFLAGAACSVLAVHALVTAAADARTTRDEALEIDRIYLSISVLPTILDSLIDYELDLRAGQPGYVQYYDDRDVLAARLVSVIDDAVGHARRAPHGAHHVMNLVGVVAYYTSAPTAKNAFARPVTERVVHQLRPLIGPTLAVMHTWRGVKSVRTRRRARHAVSIGGAA
jgi:tetraprenyl-beta-curcumene synthase